MKVLRFLLLVALPLYVLSCKPQQALPGYLEKVNDSTGKGVVKINELKIQKGDILSIQISSLSTEPKADGIYNMPATEGSGANGYLVDMQGNIEHHRLGSFHAEGLTKLELAAAIKKRLTEPVELLTSPTVVIRFLNFRVNIIGEVARVGQFTAPAERLTILEALTLAGGITDYGKKDDVMVVREVNGQRETGHINLSAKDFFDSPYYNLVQNDVVVVSPTKQRQKEVDQQKAFQKVSIALGIVMALATLTNLLIR